MVRGENLEFARLQAHQEQAWLQFLTQLAALALVRSGGDELSEDLGPENWRELLLDLTGGAEEPWLLGVEDLSKPAFFQPPVPELSLSGFTHEASTPEALTPLVMAKNHDLKAERIVAPEPEDWIFALVTLQTMQGFSGRDNYGIARMNGGFSSRPWVGLAYGPGWGDRFARDVRVLLDSRSDLLEDDLDYDDNGLALLWTRSWDGQSSLSVDELDPFFIEICRRVRLVEHGGELRARWTTTKAPRVDAKHLLGNLGDPWTPIRKRDAAALTVAESGWNYRLVCDLLFGKTYDPARAQEIRPEDERFGGEIYLVLKVLVRGQGQTGGLHERIVPIPAAVLANPETQQSLGELAEQRIAKVADVQRKILRPALCALFQGGPDDLDFKDPGAYPYLDRFDREVDRVFFEHLWADFGLEAETRDLRWNHKLYELARALFEEAIKNAPHPTARRYRAIAHAERRFLGGVYRELPGVLDRSEPGGHDSDPDDGADEENKDAA